MGRRGGETEGGARERDCAPLLPRGLGPRRRLPRGPLASRLIPCPTSFPGPPRRLRTPRLPVPPTRPRAPHPPRVPRGRLSGPPPPPRQPCFSYLPPGSGQRPTPVHFPPHLPRRRWPLPSLTPLPFCPCAGFFACFPNVLTPPAPHRQQVPRAVPPALLPPFLALGCSRTPPVFPLPRSPHPVPPDVQVRCLSCCRLWSLPVIFLLKITAYR